MASALELASASVAVAVLPVSEQSDQSVVFAFGESAKAPESKPVELELSRVVWVWLPESACCAADPGHDSQTHWCQKSIQRELSRRPQLSRSA